MFFLVNYHAFISSPTLHKHQGRGFKKTFASSQLILFKINTHIVVMTANGKTMNVQIWIHIFLKVIVAFYIP